MTCALKQRAPPTTIPVLRHRSCPSLCPLHRDGHRRPASGPRIAPAPKASVASILASILASKPRPQAIRRPERTPGRHPGTHDHPADMTTRDHHERARARRKASTTQRPPVVAASPRPPPFRGIRGCGAMHQMILTPDGGVANRRRVRRRPPHSLQRALALLSLIAARAGSWG